jgi:hypothetical protein
MIVLTDYNALNILVINEFYVLTFFIPLCLSRRLHIAMLHIFIVNRVCKMGDLFCTLTHFSLLAIDILMNGWYII